MRLVIVAALLALFAAARWAYGRRQARLAADVGPVPRVPSAFLADGPASWLVFTTPYCASCGPVADLADAFRIKRAPTVLRANHAGVVDLRLVGPDAVRRYLTP